jgi:hypothetical protein
MLYIYGRQANFFTRMKQFLLLGLSAYMELENLNIHVDIMINKFLKALMPYYSQQRRKIWLKNPKKQFGTTLHGAKILLSL